MLPFKRLKSVKFLFLNYLFIYSFIYHQGCTKLIKSDSKDFYIVTKKFNRNTALLSFTKKKKSN